MSDPAAATTLIDLADDAIKIGLGALIGAGGALTVTFFNHRQAKAAEFSRQRRDLMKTAHVEIQEICNDVSSCLIKMQAIKAASGNEAQYQEIANKLKAPDWISHRLFSTRALLHLAGCELEDKIFALHEIVYTNGTDFVSATPESLQDFVIRTGKLNHDILKAIAQEYRQG